MHRMEGGMRLYDSTGHTPGYPNSSTGLSFGDETGHSFDWLHMESGWKSAIVTSINESDANRNTSSVEGILMNPTSCRMHKTLEPLELDGGTLLESWPLTPEYEGHAALPA